MVQPRDTYLALSRRDRAVWSETYTALHKKQ